jgi:hypothetical protein
MSRKLAALLAVILAFGGCAEGGSRGSGISTAVLGNVVRVQTAASRDPSSGEAPRVMAQLRAFFASQVESVEGAPADLEGITVAVEGTGIHGETDANGDFSVAGDFEGMISLVFELPNGGGQARIALNVPAAGTLTLTNVVIDTEAEQAVAETQEVDFDAIITAIDCDALILILASSQEVSDDDDDYTLRLDTSSVRDSSGTPVPCGNLRSGDRASVRGLVEPDGTFGHATVVLEE